MCVREALRSAYVYGACVPGERPYCRPVDCATSGTLSLSLSLSRGRVPFIGDLRNVYMPLEVRRVSSRTRNRQIYRRHLRDDRSAREVLRLEQSRHAMRHSQSQTRAEEELSGALELLQKRQDLAHLDDATLRRLVKVAKLVHSRDSLSFQRSYWY